MQLYGTGIAPENPRVVYNKAEFEIGSAKFWELILTMCAQIESYRTFATLNQKHLSPNGV
jgi:hypothetical protein